MIKNRTTQLVFQTIYITLALIGFIASLGYFDKSFNNEFYVFYTNLSNYICIGIMVAIWIKTIKQALKKEDGFVDTAPKFTFMCNIMILITFLVYNILLAKDNSVFDYFTSISNLLMHVTLPILFIVHWALFYEHGKTKWYYPLLCTIMPLIYVVFILIRASILPANTTATIYPYFFLDLNTLGWGGFIGWIFALLVVFIAIGYIFYACDNIVRWKNKKRANTNN